MDGVLLCCGARLPIAGGVRSSEGTRQGIFLHRYDTLPLLRPRVWLNARIRCNNDAVVENRHSNTVGEMARRVSSVTVWAGLQLVTVISRATAPNKTASYSYGLRSANLGIQRWSPPKTDQYQQAGI
jgi:hypothetical protein